VTPPPRAKLCSRCGSSAPRQRSPSPRSCRRARRRGRSGRVGDASAAATTGDPSGFALGEEHQRSSPERRELRAGPMTPTPPPRSPSPRCSISPNSFEVAGTSAPCLRTALVPAGSGESVLLNRRVRRATCRASITASCW
jgi:hypothetical protein